MPKKPKRPCSHPGCPKLTDGRFCEEHQAKENKRYEKYIRDEGDVSQADSGHGDIHHRMRLISLAHTGLPIIFNLILYMPHQFLADIRMYFFTTNLF